MSQSCDIVINGTAYQTSMERMMGEGPHPPDEMPMARVANAVATGHLLKETNEQRQERRRRRRRQSNTSKRQTKKEFSLDLESIVRHAPAAKLNKNNFSAVIMRGYRFTTCLVFSTGSVVLVYAKSVSQGQHGCFAYKHLIGSLPQLTVPTETDMDAWDADSATMPATPSMQKMEGRLSFDQVWQENIVAYGYLGHPVNLEMLYWANPDNVHYEPDQFPGLQWSAKVIDPHSGRETKVTNLIFRTGMWLVTGAQSYGVANEVYYRLRQMACAFKETSDQRIPQGDVLRRLWLKLYEPAVQAKKRGLAVLDDLSHLNVHEDEDEEKQVMASKEARAALRRKLAERGKQAKKRRKLREEERLEAARSGIGDTPISRKRKKRKVKSKHATPSTMEEAMHAREVKDVYSPLMIAATRGDLDTVKFLIEQGEDPAYVNAAEKTIIDLVDDKKQPIYVEIKQALMEALIPKELGTYPMILGD